jgi:hypothetical protein
MRRLLQIGFEQVGSWRLREQQLTLELSRMNGQRNVLYAFVQGAAVLYVGKTTGSLEGRMGGYLKPNETQRTNVRNNQSLLQLLRQGEEIDIFAWADSGLEDSIIRTIAPPWNGARSAPLPRIGLPLSESATPEPIEAQSYMPASLAVKESESASASEVRALEDAGIINAAPVFEIVLGKTYYQNGFFNVPVKFSQMFPEDGAEITIYCGESRTLLRAKVDRMANQANHTPRIYGKGALANWFALYKRKDDVAIIRVVSANEIELV